MNYETTYNPVPRPTTWMRFQVWAYDRYGVDAGLMVGAMVSGFIGIVALGAMAIAQLMALAQL